MWFSSANCSPACPASAAASENIRVSFSNCGPCGSERKRRLLPTTRITLAPMARACAMCSTISA